ncbi:AAA family ATPase [Paenibacillus cymbidii]|uniref:AAA family ATPase n=1 Tax=Paenibacillus cymbidii TaxID=1639034 RepID=UPI001081048B|nr:AAA family ATPase [Paenibacillus cymbidii]
MTKDEFLSELDVLIRARYGIICIHTMEEERAVDMIRSISERLGKRMVTWTITQGLKIGGATAVEPDSLDLMSAIAKAEKLAEQPSLLVWLDLHSTLKSSPVYVRRFKELAQRIRDGMPSNAILIGPELEIPLELQKEVAVIDMPLPDLEETKSIIHQFVQPYASRGDLSVDCSEPTIDALGRAALGLTQSEMENCMAKSLVKHKRISTADIDFILEEKKQNVRKSGILEYISTDEMNMDQIGGLDNFKKWLDIRKAAYTPAAEQYGIGWPKGVLLVGVPGCGKSLSAKCIAASWKMPLLRLDLGRVFGMYVGTSEANIRQALAMSEAVSPSILWIDEIEKALSGLPGSSQSDGGTTSRVFGTILTWMQEKKRPVFVFATANNIASLPPELLRKGRFDEIFFVDLPSAQERAEIFRIHLNRVKRLPSRFDIDKLVAVSGEQTWGDGIRLTGSEIEACVNQALLESFYVRQADKQPDRDLITDDVDKAIRQTMPLSKIRQADIAALRAWAAENAVRASLSAGQQEKQSTGIEVTVGRNIDF